MKLSPCKHCGNPAYIVKNVTDPHLCWSVSCSNLDCGLRTGSHSQQQQAVDVWNRYEHGYSHRNGEIEVPTIEGMFWFGGQKVKALLVLAYSDGQLMWYPQGDNMLIPYGPVDNFVGQWWGPVAPPWEDKQ